jgi:hypothetical protein
VARVRAHPAQLHAGGGSAPLARLRPLRRLQEVSGPSTLFTVVIITKKTTGSIRIQKQLFSVLNRFL